MILKRLLLILCLAAELLVATDDLYARLGVHKSATKKDIRKAYTQLAKEFHPDKSDAKNAHDKFTEINQAYEVLSDPEKRRRYDDYGVLDDSAEPNFGGFGGFRGFQGFDFGRQKQHVRSLNYDQVKAAFQSSNEKPLFVMVQTDMCLRCMQIQPIWNGIVTQLRNLGVEAGTVQPDWDQRLVHLLKIRDVPQFIVVVDNQVKVYSHHIISGRHLVTFLNDCLPSKFVTLNNENYKLFFEGKPSRTRLLWARPGVDDVPLHFNLMAMKAKPLFEFGYVKMGDFSSKKVIQHFGLNPNTENLLIFHEDSVNPVARLEDEQLNSEQVSEALDKFALLGFPRISNADIFNLLCPENPSRKSVKKQKLCFLFITHGHSLDDPLIESIRQFARKHKGASNYKLGYFDAKIHVDQFKYLKGQQVSEEGYLPVVVLAQKTNNEVSSYFVADGWPVDVDNSKEQKLSASRLENLISNYAYQGISLDKFGRLVPFDDEFRAPLLQRIWKRLELYVERFWFAYETSPSVQQGTQVAMALIAVVLSLGCRSLLSSLGQTLQTERECDETGPYGRHQGEGDAASTSNPRRDGNPSHPQFDAVRREMKINPLCEANFDSLIRRASPGNLVVTLVTASCSQTSPESRDLLERFVALCLPFTKHTRLSFAVFDLSASPHHQVWFRVLLAEATGRLPQSVNPKQVAGTVLVFNGFRTYFWLYHRNHLVEMARAGTFIGLNEDPDDVDWSADPLYGFTEWLERLLDGLAVKMKLDHWPVIGQVSEDDYFEMVNHPSTNGTNTAGEDVDDEEQSEDDGREQNSSGDDDDGDPPTSNGYAPH